MKKYLHHLLAFVVLTACVCLCQQTKAQGGSINYTICKSALPFNYAGKDYFMAGNYEIHLKDVQGKDSVCRFSLSIMNNPTKSVRIGACANVLPTIGVTYNGKTYKAPGAYVDTVKAKKGCDTIVTVLVDKYTTYEETVNLTFCQGEKYNGTVLNKVGTQLFSTQRLKTHACQCDSIIYTYVTVNPAYNQNDGVISVCENTLPYNWRGVKNLFSTQNDTIHMFSKDGCDSIFTIQFTVKPSFAGSDYQVVCPEDLQNGYKYGNQIIKKADIYNIVFTASNGCDSVVTLKVNEGKTYIHNLKKEICQNELPFYFPTEHGIDSLTSPCRDTARFTSVNGCDSIICLMLLVNPAKQIRLTADICDSDLPYRFAGEDLFRGGEHTYRFPTAKGCDSVIILNLTINQSYETDSNITVCSDALPFLFQGDTMMRNGVYDFKYKTVNSCDSILHIHFTVYNTAKEAAEVTVCENAFPYTFAGQSFAQEGYYTVILKTVNGCDSIIALHINKRVIPSAPTGIYGLEKIGKEGTYLFYIDQVDKFYPITQYHWEVPDGWTIVNHNREEDSIWVEIPDNAGLNEGDITVYAYNECGKSAITAKRIKTFIKCTVRVYPNPVIKNGIAILEFNDMIGKNVVRITDLTGKILHQEEFDITQNHEEVQLPIGNFASGEYFIRIQTKDMAILKKIVVLKEASAKN